MAINIRSNPLIHGVKPPKSQNKVKYPSSLMTLPFYSRMSNQLLKPFVSWTSMSSRPGPRLTKVNAKDCGAVISLIELTSCLILPGIMTLFRIKFSVSFLVINSLLTSSLSYNVTSLAVPPWVIMHIEQAVYNFFWSKKHPLVNQKLMALPLKEGGFNIPRLEIKVQAFRLNTIRRLLSSEDAH